MAKIDVSMIENYDSMSAEEKLAALEGLDIPDPDYSGYVKKDMFDKTASELSELKKKRKNEMSAEEQAKLANEEKMKAMEEELAQMKRDKQISEHTASFIAKGYDPANALKAAEALTSGDTKSLFELMGTHQEAHDKALKAELLKNAPDLPKGQDGGNSNTLETGYNEARNRGDQVEMARYIRLMSEQKSGE